MSFPFYHDIRHKTHVDWHVKPMYKIIDHENNNNLLPFSKNCIPGNST